MGFNTVTGAIFEQIAQYILNQLHSISLSQQCRYLANAQHFRPQTLQLEAQTGKPVGMLFGAISLALADRQRLRHQQRLATQAFLIHRQLQTLVSNPLVGRVHVNHHQTLRILRQDIDAMQLRYCIAERRYILG